MLLVLSRHAQSRHLPIHYLGGREGAGLAQAASFELAFSYLQNGGAKIFERHLEDPVGCLEVILGTVSSPCGLHLSVAHCHGSVR